MPYPLRWRRTASSWAAVLSLNLAIAQYCVRAVDLIKRAFDGLNVTVAYGMGVVAAGWLIERTRLQSSAWIAPRGLVAPENFKAAIDKYTEVTTAFMGVKIDLAPRDVKVETMPHSAAIAVTRPTRPPGGRHNDLKR